MEKFIQVHNHGHVHLEDAMGSDLHIVNNARVSFDQESTEFGPKEKGLLNFLMRERHGSPWESVVFRFDVKAPLFVIREWQRHRMGCLAGVTEVTFVDSEGAAPSSMRKTMADLRGMWIGDEQLVRSMRLRVLDETTNEFVVGHIGDVIDSGVKPVFRVALEDGKQLEMTADHKILTDVGWKRLGDAAGIVDTEAALSEPVFLMTNGVLLVEPSQSPTLVSHPVQVASVTFTGMKQTYDLSVDGPWHNFVANGFVVHNSFNEQSARYSEIPDHFFVSIRDAVREQIGSPGKYSFTTIEDDAVALRTMELLEQTQRDCFDRYREMLDMGVAKELARAVLPVGMFSRMKWTVNLRALMNFISLRNHEHAQREIREYAEAVELLARDICPVGFECFDDHGRVAP